MTNSTARIREIFTSIQGEGPFIGYKQLFIRFCGCNLACKYCDTDFDSKSGKEYSIEELIELENSNIDCHSVSLTGGEPLLQADFLKEFLPLSKLPVYLETNATLPEKLVKIIDYVDYISADIKLPSCSGNVPLWNNHDRFFEIASEKILFAKVVFDENITEEEIYNAIKLASKYNIELVLQPKCTSESIIPDMNFTEGILNKILAGYKNVRLIPQVHKLLNIR